LSRRFPEFAPNSGNKFAIQQISIWRWLQGTLARRDIDSGRPQNSSIARTSVRERHERRHRREHGARRPAAHEFAQASGLH
jgi:hypothetical protein